VADGSGGNWAADSAVALFGDLSGGSSPAVGSGAVGCRKVSGGWAGLATGDEAGAAASATDR